MVMVKILQISHGFGIGISNTKARLNAMFNGDYEIMITENEQNGITVTFQYLLRNYYD